MKKALAAGELVHDAKNAAIIAFPELKTVYGFDINPQHVNEATITVGRHGGRNVQLECRT